MKKQGKIKTNALRMLDAKGVDYQVYEYDAPEGFLSGTEVAQQLGQAEEQVFKTLVIQGGSKAYYVCIVPVAMELDLKKAAKHFGEKKVEMIPAKDITNVTGYIKGGCSPLGMKKAFPTAIHMSAAGLDRVIVSAGKVGLQVELSPGALEELAHADMADLAV